MSLIYDISVHVRDGCDGVVCFLYACDVGAKVVYSVDNFSAFSTCSYIINIRRGEFYLPMAIARAYFGRLSGDTFHFGKLVGFYAP